MKKMTIVEMYQGCYKMWSKLAKTGAFRKPYKGIVNDCYACEYQYQHGDFCIVECVMSGCWRSKEKYGCENHSSPWMLWYNSNNKEDRRKYAKQIADFCANELRKRKKKIPKK